MPKPFLDFLTGRLRLEQRARQEYFLRLEGCARVPR